MAKIRMRTTAAGPEGCYDTGKEYPLDKKTKNFVPDYADFTEKPEQKRQVETPETKPELEKVYPKRTGPDSTWYELSNGEKVQGKDNAIQAEKELR